MATFEELVKSFKSKQYLPVYILYGTEPYLIDKLANYAIDNCLEPQERDFCQKIVYGKDISYDEIAMLASTQPMSFSANPKQLIVVKEAQEIKSKELAKILNYLKNPNAITILIICYKFEEARSSYPKEFPKTIEYFKSEKLKEKEMTKWVKDQMVQNKLKATVGAIQTIVDYMGSNMEGIANEIEKLKLMVGQDVEITEKHILQNMDIMKDFSMFEFLEHIGNKNHLKVASIISHYSKNPKKMELIPFLANLFNQCEDIYKIKIAQHNKKNEREIAQLLGKEDWKLRKYFSFASKVSLLRAEENLNTIFHFDRRNKGVSESGNALEYSNFLTELTQKIML